MNRLVYTSHLISSLLPKRFIYLYKMHAIAIAYRVCRSVHIVKHRSKLREPSLRRAAGAAESARTVVQQGSKGFSLLL